ncbi:MAG: FHIPEP family type III secretion protein [Planctomycetota bacterium]
MRKDTKYDMQEMGCEPRVVCRNDFLFILGAIAVITGLLFPLPSHILDILLIFSASLTAAVLIITLSAEGVLQVQSFPLLMMSHTTLRMALSVACAKMILLEGCAGTIVNLLGQFTVGSNLVLTVPIFGLVLIVTFGMVFKAAKGISLLSEEFVSEVFGFEQGIIDRDVDAGAINESQARGLRAKIAREAGFFAAMGAAAKFVLFDAVIELAVSIVTIAASVGMGIAAATAAETSLRTYVTLAVGAGMVTQTSILAATIASKYLVRKCFVLTGYKHKVLQIERGEPERIKVAAKDVASAQNIESYYGNAPVADNNTAGVQSQFVEREPSENDDATGTAGFAGSAKTAAEEAEWFDESQGVGSDSKEDKSSLWSGPEITDNNSYRDIAELIESRSANEAKTILMGAESIEDLPVTIPVNVAINLAQKHKCLLIDLDLERNAVAKVFYDDNEDREGPQDGVGVPTCINNLWIWPARSLCEGDNDSHLSRFKDLITTLGTQYDHLILYAPNVKSLVALEQAANVVGTAMLFGDRVDEFGNFHLSDVHRRLIGCGCEILEPAGVFAEAL